MKKTTLIIMLLIAGMFSKSFGQKLEENKKDDFTGKSIKRTSWESLFTTSGSIAHFCILQVGDDEVVDLKLMLGGDVFDVDKDQQMMLKLDDSEVVTLLNSKFTVTSKGAGATGMNGSGAQGVELLYPVTKDQVTQLKAHKVLKVRITTSEGAVDNDVKDKDAVKLQNCLNLI